MFQRLLTACLICFSVNLYAKSVDWLPVQQHKSLQYLLDNISRVDTPLGFVVASPSKDDPNYYYHWVRDAALVMSALDAYLPDGEQKRELFVAYLDLVLHHQSAKTLTGLGEPKFNADGSGYSGPWGRPQNDGPALRALALVRYALDEEKSNYALDGSKLRVALKRDLEYVSHNWRMADFDLWEEVKGTHFYTRMAQRSALYLGAKYFEKLGDQGAADWYRLQSQHIGLTLDRHWSAKKSYILTTLNRVGGLDYKASNLDTSVILAINHAWEPGLSFGPTDSRVVDTYEALKVAFRQVYPINSAKNGDLGVAIGRYPEDQYYGGNPWFLLTNAMAEYAYKIGRADEAEMFLNRTRLHMDKSGRMDEQYNRYNGYMLGAHDLTWSYASMLTVNPYVD